MASNTFRNNIFVNYGAPSGQATTNPNYPYSPIAFPNTIGRSGVNYLPSTTFDHNIAYDLGYAGPPNGEQNFFAQFDGSPAGASCSGTALRLATYKADGTPVTYAGITNTCSPLSWTTGGTTSNTFAHPKLVALTATYTLPTQFDLRILDTSPAFHAGATAGLPQYDMAGRAYIGGGTPSVGGLERQLYKYGWNDTGVGLYNRANGISAGRTSVCPCNGAPGGGTGSHCADVDASGGSGASCSDGTTSCGGQAGGSTLSTTAFYTFQNFCGATLSDWTGMILRSLPQHEAMVWGPNGGHGDYGGNEVYSLEFNRVTPTIARVFGPSTIGPVHPWQDNGGGGNIADPDGNPNTGHTYQQLVYLPSNAGGYPDSMLLRNRGVYGGSNYGDTWVFNLTTNTWIQIDGGTYPTVYGSPEGMFLYNPASGHAEGVILNKSYQYWNPATATTTTGGGATAGSYLNPTAALDTVRNVFWLAGDYGINPQYFVQQYYTPPFGSPTYLYSGTSPGFGTPSDSSNTGWTQTKGPTFVFTARQDRFLAIPGVAGSAAVTGAPGNTVYSVDPTPGNRLASTLLTLPGTVNVAPCASGQGKMVGMWGHFQYAETMDVYPYVPCYGTDAAVLSLQPSDPVDSSSRATPASSVSGGVVNGGVIR